MSLEEFAQEMQRELAQQLGETAQVQLHTIPRNNGEWRLALCVFARNRNGAPVIYLEPCYREFLAGKPRREILLEICRHLLVFLERPISLPDYSSWEMTCPRLSAMLVNTGRNARRLMGCPHREVLDLSLLYYLRVEEPAMPRGIAVVRRELQELWCVSEEELHFAAMENMRREQPPLFLPIREMIGEQVSLQTKRLGGGLRSEEVPAYVLTNREKHLGAAALLSEGELARCCGQLHWKGCYVLPSSIHEVILVPEGCEAGPEQLRRMVREVNREVVSAEDFLSDSLYRYHIEGDRLEIAV